MLYIIKSSIAGRSKVVRDSLRSCTITNIVRRRLTGSVTCCINYPVISLDLVLLVLYVWPVEKGQQILSFFLSLWNQL